MVFPGLSSRPALVGSLGVVVSPDAAADRVAVRISATGETTRAKPQNFALSIFGVGGSLG